MRESSTVSRSLRVGSRCIWADCSELKAKATSCPRKAHYSWARSKHKSMDRLKRAQTRSFQMQITVQVKWCISLIVYEQFEGAGKLWKCSVWIFWQILPLVDLSFLWAVMQWWEQKKCTCGKKSSCFKNCSKVRTYSFTTRPKKKIPFEWSERHCIGYNSTNSYVFLIHALLLLGLSFSI